MKNNLNFNKDITPIRSTQPRKYEKSIAQITELFPVYDIRKGHFSRACSVELKMKNK